mmetsp:Transcript_4082/g.6102  ORF Transcript_4082/g.6102 Transcript_4082/m.6102 type:complete len:137 (-) Transcript_4082:43-453(-)
MVWVDLGNSFFGAKLTFSNLLQNKFTHEDFDMSQGLFEEAKVTRLVPTYKGKTVASSDFDKQIYEVIGEPQVGGQVINLEFLTSMEGGHFITSNREQQSDFMIRLQLHSKDESADISKVKSKFYEYVEQALKKESD